MYYLTSTHFGSKGYAGEFLKRRILRVVPLYWIFTVLMLLSIWQFNAMVHHTDMSPSTVVGSLLFYPVTRLDGRIKPILLLGKALSMKCSLLSRFFTLALLYQKQAALGGLFAAFIILAVLHRYVPITATALRFWSDPIILEFLLGIVLADLYLRQVRLSWIWQCGLIVASFAMMSLLGHSPYVAEWIWGGLPAFVLVGALGIGAGVVRAVACDRRRHLLLFYLSHPFALNALALFLEPCDTTAKRLALHRDRPGVLPVGSAGCVSIWWRRRCWPCCGDGSNRSGRSCLPSQCRVSGTPVNSRCLTARRLATPLGA